MFKLLFTVGATGTGALIGNYFDHPIIGGVVGFVFAIACITGAIGEFAECVVDCID